jgi:hypothetical protein
MVRTLKLTRKISSADLLRTYLPTFFAENTHLGILERMQKRAALEEDLTRRHIDFPRWQVPQQVSPAPPPAPQPPGPAAGNGADQPR